MALDNVGTGHPTIRPRDPTRSDLLPMVRMAGHGGKVVSLATFQGRPGIAVAPVPDPDQPPALDSFDEDERRRLERFQGDRAELAMRFLCARQALVNALGPELPGAGVGVAVRGVDSATGLLLLALGPVLAEAVPEYRLDLLKVQTARRDNLIVATTLCQRAEP
jgi:hypothetical protein